MANAAPLVSVVIATYNRVNLIPLTLESVLSQTYSDFEVVVVDDASSDGTEEFMRSYGDTRVHYIRNEWSGLPSVNRNAGIRSARGEYIALVDSDDLWLPHKLQRQMNYFEAHPESNWCFTHFGYVNQDGTQTTSTDPVSYLSQADYAVGNMLVVNGITSPTPVIRKKFLLEAGMFDENPMLRFVEDWELWLRLAARARPGFIDEPLALYRLHNDNGTSSVDPYAIACRYLTGMHKNISLFPEIYGPYRSEAVRVRCLGPVKQLVLERRYDEARELCRIARRLDHSVIELKLLELVLKCPEKCLDWALTMRKSLVPMKG